MSTINRAGDAISRRVMAFGIFHDYLDYLGTVGDVFGPLQKILSADAYVEVKSIQDALIGYEHARRLSAVVMESIGLLDRRVDDVKRAYLALDDLFAFDGGAKGVLHDIDLKNSGDQGWSRKLWRELLWRLHRAGISEAGEFLTMYHFRSTRMTIDPAEYSVDRSEGGNES